MIPYHTLPALPGPLPLKTFGLFVAIGMLWGSTISQRAAAARSLDLAEQGRLALRMLAAGVVGARLAFLAGAPAAVDDVVDVIDVWNGGLQFFGGLLGASAIFAWWARTRLSDATRSADAFVLGLGPGLAVGRLGCVAVGEHLGPETSFVLGFEYRGGRLVEGPLDVGTVVHQLAFYEALVVAVIAIVLARLAPRWPAGGAAGAFLAAYGTLRFALDFLRVNDDRVLGLTGAQFGCIAATAVGGTLLAKAWRREVVDHHGSDPSASWRTS